MDDEVYKFLTRPRRIEREVLRLRARIDELNASLLPSGIRYDKDRVQTSPGDPLTQVMVQIDQLEREIYDLCIERARIAQEISDTIEELEDDEEKTVLACRWVHPMPVYQLADMMHVSRATLYRIQEGAYEHLAELIRKQG